MAVVIVSGIGAALGWSAAGEMYNGSKGIVEETTVTINSLFSVSGLQYMLTSAVTNFTSYAPLGFTIVIMLGIGVAESSGYLNGLIRKVVKVTPAALVTPMVVFIGVMTNVAENAGYVVFIPLAAMIFKAYNKAPSGRYRSRICRCIRRLLRKPTDRFRGCHIIRFLSLQPHRPLDPSYTVTPLETGSS